MKQALKIILIIGGILILIGGGVFVSALAKADWKIEGLSNLTYEEKTFETVAADVSLIKIEADMQDIKVVRDETEKITVKYKNTKLKSGKIVSSFEPSVQDGTLALIVKTEKVKQYLFNFGKSTQMVITLPQDAVYALSVKTDTGKIELGAEKEKNVYTSLSLETDTGKIFLYGESESKTDVSLKTDTGRITMDRIAAQGTVKGETDTGKIIANGRISAKDLSFKTDTGDIVISETVSVQGALSFKSDTGDVSAIQAISAGSINVKLDTGDIDILLKGKKEDYSCLLKTDTGKRSFDSYIGGPIQVNVETDTGSIRIKFSE